MDLFYFSNEIIRILCVNAGEKFFAFYHNFLGAIAIIVRTAEQVGAGCSAVVITTSKSAELSHKNLTFVC